MATGQDVRFLWESSSENPNEAISNLGKNGDPVLAEDDIRATSSPAILEMSEDKFRSQGDGRSEARLKVRHTRSCPPQLSETTPLNSRNHPAEARRREEREQDIEVEQMEERRCSACLGFMENFVDALVFFRNSKFVFLLPALFASLPLSAIIMGILFADRCLYLAISSGVLGVVGIVLIGLWIAMIILKQQGTPWLDGGQFLICIFVLAFLLLLIIDISLFSRMSPSFTKGDKNYCDETFYHYTARKEVWIVTAFVISAIVYLPRSHYCLCCCDCCSSRPNLPNMRYLSIQNIEEI